MDKINGEKITVDWMKQNYEIAIIKAKSGKLWTSMNWSKIEKRFVIYLKICVIMLTDICSCIVELSWVLLEINILHIDLKHSNCLF